MFSVKTSTFFNWKYLITCHRKAKLIYIFIHSKDVELISRFIVLRWMKIDETFMSTTKLRVLLLFYPLRPKTAIIKCRSMALWKCRDLFPFDRLRLRLVAPSIRWDGTQKSFPGTCCLTSLLRPFYKCANTTMRYTRLFSKLVRQQVPRNEFWLESQVGPNKIFKSTWKSSWKFH